MGVHSLLFSELREPVKSRSTVYVSGIWICKLLFSYSCREGVSVSPVVRMISLWHARLLSSALCSVLAVASWTAHSTAAPLSCARSMPGHLLERECGVPRKGDAGGPQGGWWVLPVWGCLQPAGTLLRTAIVSGLCVAGTREVLTSVCPFIWL